METPGASIFQGANININNSRNDEEEEDLEDQKRRNEEIQNLLLTKLDDFNYDESTVNSSLMSTISVDDSQNKYMKTETEYDQLKVLYEVRGRELQSLKEEYKNVSDKMSSQIDAVKKKLTLTEAELEQLRMSYKNSEGLLVEKVEAVKELTSVLESKEKQIEQYKKENDNLKLEITSYKSTIEDIYRQLQSEKHPFNNFKKEFNSEELKTAHQEQINKLEKLLEEQTSQVKVTKKENQALTEELNRLIDANTDNSKLIETLTRNFEGAQKQCENLIDVVESLSNENKHLQERLKNMYKYSPSKRNSLDYNTLATHVDKLKKMLLDKSLEINTLNTKLNNYEDNLKELLEYRKLKSDAYQKKFQQCNNEDHTKNLLLMQNDLQNYKRIIEDKNQQILNLNITNKELLSKMEETLSQTRNDIQEFSVKYSLPQLEKMAEDLKASEDQILLLEEQLKKVEKEKSDLIEESGHKEKSLRDEIEALKAGNERDKSNLENEIIKLKNELNASKNELDSLKLNIQELTNENTKLQSKLKTQTPEDEQLKKQYLESLTVLQDAQSKINHLQEVVNELSTNKTIIESQKCTLQFEVKELKQKLENVTKSLENLEKDLDKAREEVGEKNEVINSLKNDRSSLMEQLDKMKEMQINARLNNECNEPPSERKARRNLELELNAAEEEEKGREADLLAMEIKLRDEIQREYFNKLNEIEQKYQDACSSSKTLCKEQAEKLKMQETKFREHLAVILNGCKEKVNEFETDKEALLKNLHNLQNQFIEYKKHMDNKEERYRKYIEELQEKNKIEAEKWKSWSQKLINSCLKIEAVNKKSRDNILYNMERYDSNIEAIEKVYEKQKKKYNKHK